MTDPTPEQQPEVNLARREFLARAKKTALWAAPVVMAVTVAPRRAYAHPPRYENS